MDAPLQNRAPYDTSRILSVDLDAAVACRRRRWWEGPGGLRVPQMYRVFAEGALAKIYNKAQLGEFPFVSGFSAGAPPELVAAMGAWARVITGPVWDADEVYSIPKFGDRRLPVPVAVHIPLVSRDRDLAYDFKFVHSISKFEIDAVARAVKPWVQLEALRQRGAPDPTLRVVAYEKPTGKTDRVELRLPYVTPALADRVVAIVDAVATDNAQSDPAHVPPSWDVCELWGGCPHRHLCSRVGDRPRAFPRPPAATEIKMSQSFQDRLAAARAKQGLPPTQGAAPHAVNPPEGVQAAQAPTPPPPPRQLSLTQPGVPPAAGREDPPIGGAGPGYVPMAAATPSGPDTSFPPATPAGDPTPIRTADPWADATLYVGCAPVQEGFVLLDKWLEPLQAAAAKHLGVPHYLAADFGKGKAVLAGLILGAISQDGPPPVLVADPRLPGTDVALEVLACRYPRRVVRFG